MSALVSQTVPYNRYNYILCNSYKPLYNIPSNLNFTLESYIKSQVHFPLVANNTGRDLDDYYNALSVIEDFDTTDENIDSFYKVVKYFYKDLAESILHNNEIKSDFDFYVNLNSSINLLHKTHINRDNASDYLLMDLSDKATWQIKVKLLLEFAKDSSTTVLIELE